MYDSGPSDAELKAIGLLREDVMDMSDFEVWPENWVPFKVFSEVCTQWRMGQGGPIGLDYVAVKWVMSLMKVKNKFEVLRAIRAMESSAITQMAKS
jgi:Phage related hypothetical protein (DUF1799)